MKQKAPDKLSEQIYFYIDESYSEDFIGVAIITLTGIPNVKITRDILSSVMNDPVFKHRNNESNKVHFAENNISPRVNVIDSIYQMPVSAYLSYKKLDTSSLSKKQKDDTAYRELLPELLQRVATKYKKIFEESIPLNLQFEQLTNKKGNDELFFTHCLEGLPFNFKISVVDKNDVLTALPDYFLGLLGNLTKEPHWKWAVDDLGVVEGKIGLIIDATDSKRSYYSRGNEVRTFIKSFIA